MEGSLEHIEKTWKAFAPDFPCDYRFLDDRFNMLYSDEYRAGRIFGYFVIFAILIACLGLFGLTSFSAERRTKEIGIRKVFGASAASITGMISRDFIILAVIANITSWPIAYFLMNRWLMNFAYRTEIGAGVFILAGVSTIIVAGLTVGLQVVRVAFANPVKSLRYE